MNNVKNSFNRLVRILIGKSVFVNKGSKSILKLYFVYKIYIKKQNKTENQPSKFEALCYCIIQYLQGKETATLEFWS